MREHSLESIAALGHAVTTALVLLPLAHVRLHNGGVQLLVLHGEAGIGLRVVGSVKSREKREILWVSSELFLAGIQV